MFCDSNCNEFGLFPAIVKVITSRILKRIFRNVTLLTASIVIVFDVKQDTYFQMQCDIIGLLMLNVSVCCRIIQVCDKYRDNKCLGHITS